MTEREMLEWAAKAAGYEVAWNESWGCYQHRIPVIDTGLERHPWLPLENDGDALRLLMELELEIYFGDDGSLDEGFIPCACVTHPGTTVVYMERWGEEGNAKATRRAVTRAAAEIGRRMK